MVKKKKILTLDPPFTKCVVTFSKSTLPGLEGKMIAANIPTLWSSIENKNNVHEMTLKLKQSWQTQNSTGARVSING